MSELFADLPEALENNYNFPLRCNYRPVFSSPILPNISSDKDGNADEIIKEPLGGAHRDYKESANNLKMSIINNLWELTKYSKDELIEKRQYKYNKIGSWSIDE